MHTRYKTISPGVKLNSEQQTSSPGLQAGMNVIVVGAGVFGGWTALKLQESGLNVSLIDMGEPGNALSSSGGKSRLIRAIYGDNSIYTELAIRAFSEWKEFEKLVGEKLLEHTGVVWMLYKETENLIAPSEEFLNRYAVPWEKLSKEDLQSKLPGDFRGISSGIIELNAGYIRAREACKAVASRFISIGGELVKGTAVPVWEGDNLKGIDVDGKLNEADFYVFATGPWFGKNFPELKQKISVTRQSVIFFELPQSLKHKAYPAWIDFSENEVFYGLFQDQMFKIALDERGVEWDPSSEIRELEEEEVIRYRQFLEKRFPMIAKSHIADHRICQYSNTEDGNLFIDFHPKAANLLLMGGGSGHSFKYGPAIGKLTSDFLLAKEALPTQFNL